MRESIPKTAKVNSSRRHISIALNRSWLNLAKFRIRRYNVLRELTFARNASFITGRIFLRPRAI